MPEKIQNHKASIDPLADLDFDIDLFVKETPSTDSSVSLNKNLDLIKTDQVIFFKQKKPVAYLDSP